mmetsp:Transcript_29726/g.98514  ORF Transcript_29726/g.98514 Transcript_29726/m.98514 type:complete len:238 (+) Transcript_29726:1473-2186(+)
MGLGHVHRDVRRLRTRGPKPRPDVLGHRIPLCRIGAAPAGVERRAHRVLRAQLRATLVVPLPLGVHVAIVRGVGRRRALHPGAGEVIAGVDGLLVAILQCVQRGAAPRAPVHALDDIVLAPAWPDVLRVLAVHPERRPGATARRDVIEADDEEPGIILHLGLDADRGPAPASGDVFSVRGHEDAPCCGADQAICIRGGVVDVLHVAIWNDDSALHGMVMGQANSSAWLGGKMSQLTA